MLSIETKKLPRGIQSKDMLVTWIKFLNEPHSEEVSKLADEIQEVKEAVNELVRIGNNEKERLEYEIREKAIKDRVSSQEYHTNEGKKLGRLEEKIEIAKMALSLGDSTSKISMLTGLSIEEIESLKD